MAGMFSAKSQFHSVPGGPPKAAPSRRRQGSGPTGSYSPVAMNAGAQTPRPVDAGGYDRGTGWINPGYASRGQAPADYQFRETGLLDGLVGRTMGVATAHDGMQKGEWQRQANLMDALMPQYATQLLGNAAARDQNLMNLPLIDARLRLSNEYDQLQHDQTSASANRSIGMAGQDNGFAARWLALQGQLRGQADDRLGIRERDVANTYDRDKWDTENDYSARGAITSEGYGRTLDDLLKGFNLSNEAIGVDRAGVQTGRGQDQLSFDQRVAGNNWQAQAGREALAFADRALSLGGQSNALTAADQRLANSLQDIMLAGVPPQIISSMFGEFINAGGDPNLFTDYMIREGWMPNPNTPAPRPAGVPTNVQ